MNDRVVASLEELIALRARVPARPMVQADFAGGAAGARVAARTGRGMEYAESRPYRAGDEPRHIDWRQSARRSAIYTKLFREEHERPVHLLVDLGASMRFGTRGAFKSVAAARAAALLAWQASARGERVGGFVAGTVARSEVRPRARHHGVLALLRELAQAAIRPPAAEDGFRMALDALGRTLRPGALAVLVSDFDALDAENARAIAALALRNEVALVHIHDAFEAEAPPPGLYPVCDGKRSALLDLRSEAARARHAAPFEARRALLGQLARRAHLRLLPLVTDDAPERVLQLFSRA